MGKLMKQWALIVGLILLSGCANNDRYSQPNPADPWESFNRKIFVFNDAADTYVLAPVARGYRWVTPDPVEKGISNVFDNLFEVTTIVNDLLQLKFVQTASDSGRFLVNSTVGVLGVFDVASALGLEQHNEDFGQTLGYWGVSPGPYLVVPLLGPFTIRDGLGGIAQSQSTSYLRYVDHVPTRNSLWGTDIISTRADLLKAEELISGDKYTFLRDAYLQRREFLVKDGKVEDDFGEDMYDSDESYEDW